MGSEARCVTSRAGCTKCPRSCIGLGCDCASEVFPTRTSSPSHGYELGRLAERSLYMLPAAIVPMCCSSAGRTCLASSLLWVERPACRAVTQESTTLLRWRARGKRGDEDRLFRRNFWIDLQTRSTPSRRSTPFMSPSPRAPGRARRDGVPRRARLECTFLSETA